MDLSIAHCRSASTRARWLATLKNVWCWRKLRQHTRRFIESRDMFFLSTIDHQGRPTVSYKGGDPGFVRVLDSRTVAFPCYDGNGMFYSMGNLLGNPQVGMLFVNFENPHRLRLQGIASINDNDPLLAECAVRVTVSKIFSNFPRYVHRYKKIQTSEFVPRSTRETPLPPWKRMDDVQAFLSAKDCARVEREGGLISRAEYEKYINDVEDREAVGLARPVIGLHMRMECVVSECNRTEY